MANVYPHWARKVIACLVATVFLVRFSPAQKMVTYDTTFGGWNAIVTEDVSLSGTDSAAGIVFFPGIGQMTTNLSDLSVNGPHYLIKNGIWDGSVALGNGVHHPFIISLQPPTSGIPASTVLPKIQAILARYRIKRNSFYMTGLSMGGWQANEFVAYEPTAADNSAGKMVRAIVNLEGVEPADVGPTYPSEAYPNKMGHWARACGGRELWVEGSNDWRDMLAGAQDMMDSVAGSATYFQVTYGGGAHCCWNTEYEPSVTWTTASNANISQVVGAQVPMNVWQWLLRQGDTSMPKGTSSGGAMPPTVNAGSGQTITLPINSVALAGKATANGGSTIVSVYWRQGSGPVAANIGSSNSLNASVSGMTTAGSYVFTLYATDNEGRTSNGSMTVTVDGAVAPTVSAGKGQAITLPASSVSLQGTATANGGATIVSVYWRQGSGPVTAALGSSNSLHASASGLTVKGSYVFTLYATDNEGHTSNGSVTVTVNPAVTTAAAGVRASTGGSMFITDSATGADSAVVEQDAEAGMQIYPNPVRDLLNLRVSNGESGRVCVAVYDMRGARVRNLELDKESADLQTSLDVGRLVPGLYLIEVITGGRQRVVRKFLKQ